MNWHLTAPQPYAHSTLFNAWPKCGLKVFQGLRITHQTGLSLTGWVLVQKHGSVAESSIIVLGDQPRLPRLMQIEGIAKTFGDLNRLGASIRFQEFTGLQAPVASSNCQHQAAASSKRKSDRQAEGCGRFAWQILVTPGEILGGSAPWYSTIQYHRQYHSIP